MINYLPKKIKNPTYEKRLKLELNQVKLKRHNDSRVGISCLPNQTLEELVQVEVSKREREMSKWRQVIIEKEGQD